MHFNPKEPFPLFSLDDYSYAQAKLHAAEADAFFHLDTASAELAHALEFPTSHQQADIVQGWTNLPVETLMTPYLELRIMLEQLQLCEAELIVDLGCAYGRLGLLINFLKLPIRYLGFELSSARVQAAKNSFQLFSFDPNQIQLQDLQSDSFAMPFADVYFIYDYGSEAAIEKTLNQIKSIAQNQKIKLLGRGRRTRHLIHLNHPWLAEVNPPQHFPTFSVYYS